MAFGKIVKVVRTTQAPSLARARKAGGMAASGDAIAFFDSHQEVQPGWYVLMNTVDGNGEVL